MLRTCLIATLLLTACGSDEPAAPRCADTTAVIALPTPLWDDGEHLAPPPGDAAAALLTVRRQPWCDQLDGADGWPARPTFVIPLSGPAEAVSPAEMALYGRAEPGGPLEPLDIAIEAEPDEETSTSLIARPAVALPDLFEAVLVISEGAVTGAEPLPACGDDGRPHPAYAEARSELPGDDPIQLALPFRLATTHRQLPALGERLAASPVLAVDSVEARALDDFGDDAPAPEVAALLADPAAAGILELPDYRGDGGAFTVDGDGLPQPAGTTMPGFIVALPAEGEPPFPFVLFQHGGSQSKSILFGLAGPLAAAGYALVAIDLPGHGDRAEDGGGTDLDILDFMDLLKTRDNLRQASADHLAVLTGIEALNEAIEPILGVTGALDPDRSFYMGLSLGGITGSLTFTSAPNLRAAALFVAAADYPTIVSSGVFSLLVQDVLARSDLDQAAILGLAEVLLDGADPLAYGLRAEDRTADPRPLLMMQAVDDPVVSMDSSDLWGLSFGAALARPFHHEVAGMDQVDLPAADTFSWSGGPAVTRIMVQNPMAEVPMAQRHGGLIMLDYSQEMVAHCFTTLLDSGSCEIIDTGFAER